jgi:hypothetical protein
MFHGLAQPSGTNVEAGTEGPRLRQTKPWIGVRCRLCSAPDPLPGGILSSRRHMARIRTTDSNVVYGWMQERRVSCKRQPCKIYRQNHIASRCRRRIATTVQHSDLCVLESHGRLCPRLSTVGWLLDNIPKSPTKSVHSRPGGGTDQCATTSSCGHLRTLDGGLRCWELEKDT